MQSTVGVGEGLRPMILDSNGKNVSKEIVNSEEEDVILVCEGTEPVHWYHIVYRTEEKVSDLDIVLYTDTVMKPGSYIDCYIDSFTGSHIVVYTQWYRQYRRFSGWESSLRRLDTFSIRKRKTTIISTASRIIFVVVVSEIIFIIIVTDVYVLPASVQPNTVASRMDWIED